MDHSDHHEPESHHGASHDEHASHNEHASHTAEHHASPDHSSGPPISLSKYTQALINTWQHPPKRRMSSANRISVSQTVSFLAFLYEKVRNAIEFREDHLIRRAAIERIIRRRMILNGNGREIAELLIKELLWARYYENNTIEEEKIPEIQAILDKYFFIRNELSSGRSHQDQDKIADFIIEILSCEVEESLSPNARREAFTNYVYQVVRPHIELQTGGDETECDTQIYIAVEKTFGKSDTPIIRYHLLKLMVPEITTMNWKSSETILPKLYDVYREIEKQMHHPLADKTRNVIRKNIPPFLILRDIFEQNSQTVASILPDETKLKHKVDDAARKRYEESRNRLRRTALRSFIYILLTKVIFAFILEVPYDLYVLGEISYMPIFVNVLVPPALMALIILTVSVPGDDNTRRIYEQIKSIIDHDPDGPGQLRNKVIIGKKPKVRSFLYTTIFTLIYLAMYVVSFGSIIWLLSYFNFTAVSQAIFLFFITLVLFFTYRVIQISKEYQVVEKETILTPLTDFFFLPFIKVGQWLSGEVLTRFNILIVIFDFIIEMPFKAIAEVIDEWVHFVKVKKEEIV